ncbi:hypothetical protein BSKO_10823 [Bryopsis sp. KO-2023]|nr:hypothetical protein BSKO_10823 [Bryopsis sp. KO-2023]
MAGGGRPEGVAITKAHVVRESRRLLITTMEAILHDPAVKWVKKEEMLKTDAEQILATVDGKMEDREDLEEVIAVDPDPIFTDLLLEAYVEQENQKAEMVTI